jgi:hypothetical protein
LTKFIDHRHRKIAILDLRFAIAHKPRLHHHHFPFTGRVRRNKRSITCHIAKKVLDDVHPTERQTTLQWGSLLCRDGHRGGSFTSARPEGVTLQLRPFTLNLTYSLVKEQTNSRRMRVSLS